MANGVNNAMKGLFDGIKHYVDTKIRVAEFDRTEIGVVVNINPDDSYDVKVEGVEYTNIPSRIGNIKHNDIVDILIPKNKYSNMRIVGKI